MARSMTGFGSHELSSCGFSIQIIIRSLNGRHLDVNYRSPEELLALERALLDLVKEHLHRGSVSVSVRWGTGADAQPQEIRFHSEIAEGYLKALRDFAHHHALSGSMDVNHLAALPEVFTLVPRDIDKETLHNDILEGVRAALKQVVELRESEGANLDRDLREKIAAAEEFLATIEGRAVDENTRIRERLLKKISERFSSLEIDEQRLEQEVLFYVEKSDINEEIVRLKSHFEHIRDLLAKDGPIGRKLEFLLQETHREINTIGSKSDDLDITRAVIELKNLNEQMKEQARNVE